MPKIIENVREQLLAEAKRQIAERGYAATTIRSVAGACGVGVGTVYNYFDSKEMLIATFVFEDWLVYLKRMQSLPTDDAYALLLGVYDSLKDFALKNQRLFSDEAAHKLASDTLPSRHKMLRAQIADIVLPACSGEKFTAQFVAESLITWSMENADFDTVYHLIEKIILK